MGKDFLVRGSGGCPPDPLDLFQGGSWLISSEQQNSAKNGGREENITDHFRINSSMVLFKLEASEISNCERRIKHAGWSILGGKMLG